MDYLLRLGGKVIYSADWLPVAQAAVQHGVFVRTLRRRIARGQVTAAMAAQPNGSRALRVEPPHTG
ncbi:MAG TPA: hypothetical protein VF600_18395 [Abditibacteriaceae bacterium]|jgi:hypothetical protein